MECGDEIPGDMLCNEESITELHLTDEHNYHLLGNFEDYVSDASAF